MIVHRFMSSEEYGRLVKGETLENHRHHAKGGAGSVGFCFTQEAPELAIRWLSGIVDTDYCVTFRVRDKGLLRPDRSHPHDRAADNGGDAYHDEGGVLL